MGASSVLRSSSAVYSRDLTVDTGHDENLGHLLELEALVNLEHHGFALFGGQPVQRAGHRQAQFDGETALPPTVMPVPVASGRRFVHIDFGLALAEQGIGLVVGDAIQPGRETRRIVEFAEILIRLQENVLRQVQSVFAVRRCAAGSCRHASPTGRRGGYKPPRCPGVPADQVGIFDRPKDQSLAPGEEDVM